MANIDKTNQHKTPAEEPSAMSARRTPPDDHSPQAGQDRGTPQDGPAKAGQPTSQPPPTLEEQLHAAIAERDDYFDKWTRAQAELENYRKRMQKEMEQNRRYQAMPLLRDLVSGLDNLSRAIEAAESSRSIDDLREGVKLVAKQFQDALASHSAVPIEAMGQPFDPNLHEAVQQVPTDEYPPMTVVGEVQRGWLLHDRVVRPSIVLVSVAPSADTPDNSTPD